MPISEYRTFTVSLTRREAESLATALEGSADLVTTAGRGLPHTPHMQRTIHVCTKLARLARRLHPPLPETHPDPTDAPGRPA